MRKLLSVLFILTLPHLALGAGALGKQKNYKDADARYADIQKSCLDKTNYLNSCMLIRDDQLIDPSVIRKAQSETVEGALSKIGRHFSYHTRNLVNEKETRRRAEVRGKYNVIKNKAIKLAKEKKLQSCQKACLATCISSRLLEYDTSLFNQACVRRTMDGAIETQKGVCRNYAQIGDDLMEAFGLTTKKVYGDDHAINAVKLDGIWYQMEPQDDTCAFYYNDGGLIKKDAGTSELIKDSPIRKAKDIKLPEQSSSNQESNSKQK